VTQLDDRLVRCFLSAFPTLTQADLQTAVLTRLADLDSLAGVTLVALIDDEFGIDMDLEGLLELGTFQSVRQYLREHGCITVATKGEPDR
jgi:acyl carrier protein